MENQDFGARLRELRKHAGLSQRDLARKVGVDFTYLSKIESGAMPPPSEKVILRIVKALNADRDELLTLAGKIPADIAQILKNRRALQLLRSSRTQKKLRAANNKEGINIMKNLFSYRYLSRTIIAVVLVCAVAASLWFASPTKALDVSFTTLPSGSLGSSRSFTVKVDVPNPELVPIQSIDMEIYSVSDPTKKMTTTSLPLTNGGSASYSTSGGTVSLTASTTNWQWFSGSGYADWKGTGYLWSPPNVLGYGYGAAGTASIQYSGTWTSPIEWASGNYQIKVTVNTLPATSPDSTQAFTEYSSQFSMTKTSYSELPRRSTAAPAPKPGVTELPVNSRGVFTEQLTAVSDDGKAELYIEQNTIGKTKDDQPLFRITAFKMADPPAPPADSNVIGLTYDLGPGGATFAPPLTITLEYDETLLAEGTTEADLVIAFYDTATGEWIELKSVVDPETNTITALVSHFTPFSIITKPAAPVPPEAPPTPEPAAFNVSSLSVSPASVSTGEPVAITVAVANTGGSAGSYTVTLKINGVQESEKSATVAAGSSQTVSFSVTRGTSGSYSVEVNGLSASFTVTTPPTTPTVPTPPTTEVPEVPAGGMAWWIWLIICLVAVAVVGVVVWLVRKRM
ncbi:helix-turn-helix domain-containing protein [Chloroflexota bacterium]